MKGGVISSAFSAITMSDISTLTDCYAIENGAVALLHFSYFTISNSEISESGTSSIDFFYGDEVTSGGVFFVE